MSTQAFGSNPELTLPAAALPAWEAYEAMLCTKEAHFSFLQRLENRIGEGGQPTLAERARLEKLLQAHSARVEAFRGELDRLRAADSVAHRAFVEHIKLASTPAGQGESGH